MEADELAGTLRDLVDTQIKGWPYDIQSDPAFANATSETGNEDTGFFLEFPDGERFLVTVAKVA